MGRLLRFATLAAVALAAASCLSPTLPLPPPASPTQEAGTEPGTIHLHGKGVEAHALVVIENNTPLETLTNGQAMVTATEADATGVWDADNVHAVKGDVLTIWQEFGNNEASPSISFQVN
jgi:hypothetical protein